MAFFGEVSAFSLSHIPDLKGQHKGCVIDFSWENMSKYPLTLNREPTPTIDQSMDTIKVQLCEPTNFIRVTQRNMGEGQK